MVLPEPSTFFVRWHMQYEIRFLAFRIALVFGGKMPNTRVIHAIAARDHIAEARQDILRTFWRYLGAA